MELSDFATFVALLAMILPSFGAIRYVLKRTGWGERKSLFLDTWKVWLSWIISSLVLYVMGLIVADNVHSLGYLPLSIIMFPAVLAGNILTIASVLKSVLRNNEETGISTTEGPPTTLNLSVWKTSVLASVLAMATLISMFGTADLVTKVYDWNYPQPNYGIYD